MLEQGVDVYSAIELVDNAGRTPLYEAVEKEGDLRTVVSADKMIQILTKPKINKQNGGFGAKVNILNYNGQSPLFHATRSNNFASVKALVEMGASPDLNNGEMVSEENQGYDSDEEDE